MHKWYQATDCPGAYLESQFPWIAQEVNKLLDDPNYSVPAPSGAITITGGGAPGVLAVDGSCGPATVKSGSLSWGRLWTASCPASSFLTARRIGAQSVYWLRDIRWLRLTADPGRTAAAGI